MACVRTISYAIIYNYDAVYIEHAARYFDILSQKEWAALIWSSVEVIGEAMSRPEVKPRVNCRHLISAPLFGYILFLFRIVLRGLDWSGLVVRLHACLSVSCACVHVCARVRARANLTNDTKHGMVNITNNETRLLAKSSAVLYMASLL